MLAAPVSRTHDTDLWAMPVQSPTTDAKRMRMMKAAWASRVKARSRPSNGGVTHNERPASTNGMWVTGTRRPDNSCPRLGEIDQGTAPTRQFCTAFRDLVIKGQDRDQPADRDALYKQAQLVFKEQAPGLTIALLCAQAGAKEVIDFKLSVRPPHFYGVDIKE